MPTQRQHHGFDDMTLIIQKNKKITLRIPALKTSWNKITEYYLIPFYHVFSSFSLTSSFFFISSRKIIVQNQNKTAWRIIFHTIEW